MNDQERKTKVRIEYTLPERWEDIGTSAFLKLLKAKTDVESASAITGISEEEWEKMPALELIKVIERLNNLGEVPNFEPKKGISLEVYGKKIKMPEDVGDFPVGAFEDLRAYLLGNQMRTQAEVIEAYLESAATYAQCILHKEYDYEQAQYIKLELGKESVYKVGMFGAFFLGRLSALASGIKKEQKKEEDTPKSKPRRGFWITRRLGALLRRSKK